MAKRSPVVYGRFCFGKGFVGGANIRLSLARAGNRGGEGQATITTNSTAIAVFTLLALGTYTAGLQVYFWQVCSLGPVTRPVAKAH